MEENEIETLLKQLPKMLEMHPELKGKLYAILSKEYVTREDFYTYMKRSDKQWRELLRLLDEHRAESNKRFEAMDKRFETLTRELDEHRAESNKRFEAMDKRFETLTRELNEHRAENNKRFEAMRAEYIKRFELTDKKIDRLFLTLEPLARRTGDYFESVIRRVIEYSMGITGGKVENLIIKDTEGKLLKQNEDIDLNEYIHDDVHIFCDVKTRFDRHDVTWFLARCEFAERKLRVKSQRAVICLEIDEPAVKFCQNNDITVLTYPDDDIKYMYEES
jgi:hypothetical protein